MEQRKRKVHFAQILLVAVIVFTLVLMLYPLAMALWNSFKTDLTYESTRWFPTLPLRWKNLVSAFDSIYKFLINTLIVAGVGIPGMLLIASMASFAFTKIRFPGKTFFFYMVMALMMVPTILTLIPAFLLYKSMGLQNSLMSLIIPLWTSACVGSMFLLVSFMASLPNELFEAAQIDGGGVLKSFWYVALPLSAPILGTVAIMQIVSVWNDYIWPRIILDETKFTISAGLLLTFSAEYTANMPVMFAAYLVSSSPLILLFIFANKFYIRGLTSAGIKM
ncbi:MAG: carbohydrate ABC transporter permease [Clostridia bacterium]|nr:carbohydrate ABC transporter permease [Clostridia bacterium]